MLLTKKGWLATPVNHNIKNFSRLNRLFHVDDITGFEYNLRVGLGKIFFVFLNCFCIINILYACYLYTSNFGYSNLLKSSEFSEAWHAFDPITDNIFLNLVIIPLFSIAVHYFFINPNSRLHLKYRDRNGEESSLTLLKKHESMLTNIITYFCFFLGIWFFFGLPDFSRISSYLWILPIIGFLLYYQDSLRDEFVFWKSNKRYFKYHRFKSSPSIIDFHSKLKTLLPMSEVDGKLVIDRRINNKYAKLLPNEKYLELKSKIKSHDSSLSKIIKNYHHIFLGEDAPWFNCSAVRSSTEKLLHSRVEIIFPKTYKNKNLSDFRNLLKGQNDITPDILRDIDHISASGNAAVHNMEASTSDYMSMLEKFVNVVDWHISNPPISIVDRED